MAVVAKRRKGEPVESGPITLHIKAPWGQRLLLFGWSVFFAFVGIGLWESAGGFSAQLLLEVLMCSAASIIMLNEAMLEYDASEGVLRRRGLLGVRVIPVPITANVKMKRHRIEVWAADKRRLAVLDSRFNRDGDMEFRLTQALGLQQDQVRQS